jgi:hypothetical protein
METLAAIGRWITASGALPSDAAASTVLPGLAQAILQYKQFAESL